ncbi:MAG: TetR/AcrR family transcriptional regulator [Acidimicrobiia bacterium]|nr:TetR/AcrR family transcriptional regulator [Acidimicrobiia bacterium]
MRRLRWGDDAPVGVDEARQRIVDAAEACVDRLGLAKATVEDVAGEARVSRATVYRYFSSRDELVLAVLLRELERTLDPPVASLLEGLSSSDDVVDAVVASAVHLLAAVRSNEKLQLLLTSDVGGVSATLAGASVALFEAYVGEVAPPLARAQEQGWLRTDVSAEDLAEWMLRILVSLLTVEGPHPRTPEQERRLLCALLAPALRLR